ncbi:translation elongation factor P (EF-P) [Brevinema andersonii]|uniref:Elongation factor P n=1 Tax=Brevinema andersonii TaxID=34097 RepID=A0A1I1EA04_BREAD|nr:elongation factor P [Brevinema andersonii]SFB82168.1 translation elongation factor P (EF-P) [Brevinema andersonii]
MNYEDIKKGMILKFENDLWYVAWCQHHKPGKGGAVMRTKLRNVLRGNMLERVFRGGDTLEQARVDNKTAQLLYRDGLDFVFMDQDTFEQYTVSEDIVGDAVKYLKDQMLAELKIYQDEVIAVEPPMFVELEVVETDPGLRGDTVSGGSKPATLETGAVVQVPLFVNVGEKIRVDTRDDRYIERVK